MLVGGGDMEHLASADKDAVDGELRRDILFIEILLHGGDGPCAVDPIASRIEEENHSNIIEHRVALCERFYRKKTGRPRGRPVSNDSQIILKVYPSVHDHVFARALHGELHHHPSFCEMDDVSTFLS